MESAAAAARAVGPRSRYGLIVVLFAAAIYLIACISPPSLMDDVDAVQAQIARNMLDSGDWVTARLNGVAYLEKSPLVYWLIALAYSVFGVHDWAARIPIALASTGLAWLTWRMGRWAFGEREGLLAGLAAGTCVGLWLFTRILIPDVLLTFTIALAMWSFLRALEEDEPQPRLWSMMFPAAIGTGLLLKGLIAAVIPVAAAGLYLLVTRQLFVRRTWQRLRPFTGIAIIALIAAPWHILATLRNPPYLDLTPRSEPGKYHGFFWFYFLNEHVFRFLNMRHPRDYNTVPRHLFWLFHLLWLFPWSAFLTGLLKLSYRPVDRAGRMRLLALCWAGFVLVFFTFSTTQEYYSMPVYPALALLLGCAMARHDRWTRWGAAALAVIGVLAAATCAWILAQVWNLPTPGDISNALTTQGFDAYTLSLGHMGDLTLRSFAYLRSPLVLAGVAFALLAYAGLRLRETRMYLAIAAAMVLFLNAARLAMIAFDPYLSSPALAEALVYTPSGRLIVDNQYYTFSSVFFYAGAKASRPEQRALLLNGRVTNLEYGSYAPGAPDVFIDDREFARLWQTSERYYLLTEGPQMPRIERLTGGRLHTVKAAGGKYLLTNDANLH
jgi:4-amino-4-deoxy-L-arabinose transferase-like glycosyltransferase